MEYYHENCLDTIASRLTTVDVVVADPPYGISFQSSWTEKSVRFDKILNDEKPFTEWIRPCADKLNRGGANVCLLQIRCAK